MKLPSGWKEVKLGDVAKVTSGGTPSKDNPSFWNGSIPWISALEMHKNYVNSATLAISEEGLKKGSTLAKRNDLLLLTRGSMLWKKIPVCLCLNDVAFNQDIKCLHPNENVDSKYLLYWFGSVERTIMQKVEGTGIGAGKLDTQFIKDLQIPLPPLEEQKKIAETLSTWDSAIEKMEKLIDEKENLFKVELKAKIIVRGFEENWEKFTVKDCVVALTPPSRISQDNYKKTGNFPVIDQSKEPIAGWTNDENCIIRSSNPLIIFGDHTCILKIMKIPFAQGADGIKVLSANDRFDAPFLYYSLKADPVVPEGYKRHYSSLQRKEVFCPSKDIQKKLARYFEIKDKELSLLKQQLALYKKQKQGLMQKLLTGEWRVK